MRNYIVLVVMALIIIDVVLLYYLQTGTNGHGLYGMIHLTSVPLTELPRAHHFISLFPILLSAAVITAIPVFLVDRSRRGLTGSVLVVVVAMTFVALFRDRITGKLDEYSVFYDGGVERTQLMRIYGATAFRGQRSQVFSVEINPHHLAQGGTSVPVSGQVYDFVQSGLYRSAKAQDQSTNGGWQTDYCLRFTVERVGSYERIIFRRHLIRSDELVSCPKDAA